MTFAEQIRKSVAQLRDLVQLETSTTAVAEPSTSAASSVRRAADRLFYMDKSKTESITVALRKALEDLDAAVQTAGGADGEWGRRVMNLVRKLDGFEVSTILVLRSDVDGFARPSSLRFTTSLPMLKEKPIDTIMTGLYDLADEMEGVRD